MPAWVSRTLTFALNNATLPPVLALADKGVVMHYQDSIAPSSPGTEG